MNMKEKLQTSYAYVGYDIFNLTQVSCQKYGYSCRNVKDFVIFRGKNAGFDLRNR